MGDFELTDEEIKQAIKEARKRRPGIILSAKQVYEAIARTQLKKAEPLIRQDAKRKFARKMLRFLRWIHRRAFADLKGGEGIYFSVADDEYFEKVIKELEKDADIDELELLKQDIEKARQDERERAVRISKDYFELTGAAFLAEYPVDEKAYWDGQDGEGLIQALKTTVEGKEG